MEVSIIDISYTSGRCSNVCSGCWARWGHSFGPLHCYTVATKTSMMSNSANIMLGHWIQRQGPQVYKSGQQASVCYVQVIGVCSFTVHFQKSFCIRWISVYYMELRSVCFFGVESVLIQINWGQVICPTYRGSPLLEGTLFCNVLIAHCNTNIPNPSKL